MHALLAWGSTMICLTPSELAPSAVADGANLDANIKVLFNASSAGSPGIDTK
jgi:hypothetical protein